MGNSTFSKRLKIAMELRNLKAADLARKTGLSQGIISNYKAGRFEASQTNLQKLAAALDVSIPWLMGYDVPMGRYEMAQLQGKADEIAARLQGLSESQLELIDMMIDSFEGVER